MTLMDEALAQLLARVSPALDALLREHRAEHGELLTTLFLAEVARYAFGARDALVIDTVNDLLVIGGGARAKPAADRLR